MYAWPKHRITDMISSKFLWLLMAVLQPFVNKIPYKMADQISQNCTILKVLNYNESMNKYDKNNAITQF